MLNKLSEHKLIVLMSLLCVMLLSSISITLAYKNTLTDSISITTSVLLSACLCLTLSFFIIEKVRSICNP